ncbi:hypothetical protein OH77DRAFT_622839 [Trametes cingulata]|nr:hypothetical protein OH77DRAFT_622839 [Trametes cingulata]
MSVMTATPHIDSYERHHVASSRRTSGSTRGDSSSPYTYVYTQKHCVDNMDPWNISKQAGSTARQPTGQPQGSRASREPARAVSYTHQHPGSDGARYAPGQSQPPTASWQYGNQRPYLASTSARTASLGSAQYANVAPPWSLSGTFSGSWSSARTPAGYTTSARGGAWTESRERHTARMYDDSDESSDSMRSSPDSVSTGRRGSANSTGSSDILPLVPNRVPALSESDILLGTSVGRLHPATFSPERPRPRAASWESESVQLPPLRSYAPQRASIDYSPDVRELAPPAKRACVQLPSFPEFVQGSSRPSFDGSSSRRNTASPPPSPSPSAASICTTAYSAGHTDTEPTEDDAMGDSCRSGSYPPCAALHPSRRMASHALSPARPSHPLEEDMECEPLPPPLIAADANVQTGGAREEPTKQRKQEQAAESKPRRRNRTRPAEPKEPAQKKYRFVASRLSGEVAPPPEFFEVVERGRAPVAQSGSKRKHANACSPSPASSEDVPLSALRDAVRTATMPQAITPKQKPEQQSSVAPTPQPQPGAQAPTAPPKRRGRPPRPAYDVESFAPIDPDSPEAKGQFPEYRFEGERGLLQCKFPGCTAQLTGKKAEMTTHLKAHFHAAGGQSLICPWEVTNRRGEKEPCGQSFRDSANMGRHVTTRHARVEEYQCGRCGRPFSRRDAALRHMKTMCSPEKQRWREQRIKTNADVESEDEDEENDEDDSGSSVDNY